MKTKIYLVENCYDDPNKVYIGKTKNPKLREQEHRRKFGDNIKFIIIDEINSLQRKKWKPLETKWIQHYIDLDFNILNKNKGGSGPCYQKQSMKDKISNVHKGNQYNLNRKQSPKTINKRLKNIDWNKVGEKISISKKGIRLSEEHKKNLRTPKGPMDEKTKLKLSKSQKGISKTKNKKPIIQMDINNKIIKEWPSQTEASLKLKIKQGDISSVLHGKQITAGGFKFKFQNND